MRMRTLPLFGISDLLGVKEHRIRLAREEFYFYRVFLNCFFVRALSRIGNAISVSKVPA